MSNYQLQPDGAVSYTGKPEDYSEEAAAAVASGLELGSEPSPTGTPPPLESARSASRRRRRDHTNPAGLEKGSVES